MAKALSTLEAGLVAAGTGQLLRCLADLLVAEGLTPHRPRPYFLGEDGLVPLLVGLVGSAATVQLLARRAAAPLRSPLGALLAGCAVALLLGIGSAGWWPEGARLAWTLLLLGAGLAAGLGLALRPPLRPRSPRRAAALALAAGLAAGAPVLRDLVLDAWPKDYPPFVLELVPTSRIYQPPKEGQEAWGVSYGSGLLRPLGPGVDPTHRLERGRAVRLGPDDVLRLSWRARPLGMRCRLGDRAGARVTALTRRMRGELLLVFVDGVCLMQAEVGDEVGRTFVITEGQTSGSPVRALYERLTGERAPR